MACGADAAFPHGGQLRPLFSNPRVLLLSTAVKKRGTAKHFPVRKVYKSGDAIEQKNRKISSIATLPSPCHPAFGLTRRLNGKNGEQNALFSFPSISELSMVCLQDANEQADDAQWMLSHGTRSLDAACIPKGGQSPSEHGKYGKRRVQPSLWLAR